MRKNKTFTRLILIVVIILSMLTSPQQVGAGSYLENAYNYAEQSSNNTCNCLCKRVGDFFANVFQSLSGVQNILLIDNAYKPPADLKGSAYDYANELDIKDICADIFKPPKE
jgi:hypothetical protein